MKVPDRYRDYFEAVPPVQSGPLAGKILRWECKRCGQLLFPNTAGAESHLSKHVGEVLCAKAEAGAL